MSSTKRSSRPPPAPSPTARPQPPRRRDTMEVQLEWLEDEPRAKPRKGPPPLPNARVQPPPMPVARTKPPPPERASTPPQRQTMEVDMRDVILVPHAPRLLLAPRRPVGKPIPREEEDSAPTPPTSPGAKRKSPAK